MDLQPEPPERDRSDSGRTRDGRHRRGDRQGRGGVPGERQEPLCLLLGAQERWRRVRRPAPAAAVGLREVGEPYRRGARAAGRCLADRSAGARPCRAFVRRTRRLLHPDGQRRLAVACGLPELRRRLDVRTHRCPAAAGDRRPRPRRPGPARPLRSRSGRGDAALGSGGSRGRQREHHGHERRARVPHRHGRQDRRAGHDPRKRTPGGHAHGRPGARARPGRPTRRRRPGDRWLPLPRAAADRGGRRHAARRERARRRGDRPAHGHAANRLGRGVGKHGRPRRRREHRERGRWHGHRHEATGGQAADPRPDSHALLANRLDRHGKFADRRGRWRRDGGRARSRRRGAHHIALPGDHGRPAAAPAGRGRRAESARAGDSGPDRLHLGHRPHVCPRRHLGRDGCRLPRPARRDRRGDPRWHDRPRAFARLRARGRRPVHDHDLRQRPRSVCRRAGAVWPGRRPVVRNRADGRPRDRRRDHARGAGVSAGSGSGPAGGRGGRRDCSDRGPRPDRHALEPQLFRHQFPGRV